MPELPKAYTPHDVEGAIYERWLAADVFAPDGAGSTADPRPPAVHDHPAATEHHRLAPPRPRPAHRGRGPDDPARPDARSSGALPAGPRPRLDRRPVRPRRDPRQGGESRQSLGRERYLERMREFVATTREVMLAQQRRVGASADWGRLRYTMDDRSAKAVRTAFERLYRADLAYRTEALVNWCPGCRTSVSDLEVVSTPETGTLWSVRYHLIDPATGQPDPGRHDHRRHDPARDDPRRHRRGGPPRRRALHGARRADGPHPVRRARRPDHRRRDRRSRRSGPGAVKITPAHDHDDHADRPSPRPPGADHPGRRRDDRRDRDALRRHGPLRGANGDRRRPRGARRPGRAPRRTRWSSGAASAATTSSSRASRRSGSSGPGRSRNGRSRRPARAGPGSSPSDSRRPGSTG